MMNESTLRARIKQKRCCLVDFDGNKVLLDSLGVLFWPEFELLVFSDLHFEKGSFLSQFANPIPRMDTQQTLSRMSQCLAIYQPAKVLCLGDSFHDLNAVQRMQQTDIATLNEMVTSISSWHWILGNHDPSVPKDIYGDCVNSFKLKKTLLVHEPQAFKDSPLIQSQVVGHFHPKTRARVARQNLSGKCFVLGQKILLMPAFGQYTGGLNVMDEAIQNLFDDKQKHFILVNEKVYQIT